MTVFVGRPDLFFAPDIDIGKATARVAHLLSGIAVDSKLEARLLVGAAAELGHLDLIRDPHLKLGEEASIRLAALLERRLAHEPVSRILGRRGFWKQEVEISPAVLDPRADTETLIEAILQLFGTRLNEPLRVVDLGTGSGAILCALLQEFPNAVGVGVDVSPDACRIARANLARAGVSGRSLVQTSYWGDGVEGRFDLVVSNPPYIESQVIETLQRGVSEFDPRLALDGGADGLDAYRAIGGRLGGLMSSEAIAVFEIGFDQAISVSGLMAAFGFRQIGSWRDLGGHERALAFRISDRADR